MIGKPKINTSFIRRYHIPTCFVTFWMTSRGISRGCLKNRTGSDRIGSQFIAAIFVVVVVSGLLALHVALADPPKGGLLPLGHNMESLCYSLCEKRGQTLEKH